MYNILKKRKKKRERPAHNHFQDISYTGDFLTSCPCVGGGEWAEVLQHVVHHAHFGLFLGQRNSYCGSFRNKVTAFIVRSMRTLLTVRVRLNGVFLTSRADVFEGSRCNHAEGSLQLPNELPRVQSVAQVDKARSTVDH